MARTVGPRLVYFSARFSIVWPDRPTDRQTYWAEWPWKRGRWVQERRGRSRRGVLDARQPRYELNSHLRLRVDDRVMSGTLVVRGVWLPPRFGVACQAGPLGFVVQPTSEY